MKIIYICAYKDNVIGGVPSVVPQYLEYMSEWADIYVFSYSGLLFENNREKFRQIKTKKELLKEIKNIDIIVFHEVYYIRYYKLARQLVKNGIPYIVIPHCSLTQGAQEQKRLIKQIINRVWVNKFISHTLRVQYLSVYEKENSKMFAGLPIIIPNGISPVVSKIKKYQEHNSLELVFIGRFSVNQKGLDLLIDACALIKEEITAKKININLYGTDFERGKDYIQDKIERYKLCSNIQLHDSVYGEDKQRVLLESDIFILTSRFEGMPMGILEAMQIGLPVFVTPGSGFGKIVQEENCGWCVEGNVSAIAEGILQVAGEKERLVDMSENAVKVVKEYYAWDKVAMVTKKEYERVLKAERTVKNRGYDG